MTKIRVRACTFSLFSALLQALYLKNLLRILPCSIRAPPRSVCEKRS
jgi:hypothetical protein